MRLCKQVEEFLGDLRDLAWGLHDGIWDCFFFLWFRLVPIVCFALVSDMTIGWDKSYGHGHKTSRMEVWGGLDCGCCSVLLCLDLPCFALANAKAVTPLD